ncbi:MAG: AMP-binding protein [Alphaproteobacteria bacterium]|nr:AMP-binding protein [Alphaproteobacteria bacterium]
MSIELHETKEASQPVEQKDRQARHDELLRLLEELASELHPGRRGITPVELSSSLERNLGIDSLARLEMALRLERRFGVRLAERDLMEAETPADLLAAIDAAGPDQVTRPHERVDLAQGLAVHAPITAATLIDVLDYHVSQHGDREHIRLLGDKDEAETITYAELWQGAQSIAAGLRDHGLAGGETVAIMLPTSADFFSVFVGTLLAGCVPVPIYPPMRRAQIEEHLKRQAGILRNAKVSMLVTTEDAMLFGRLIRAQVETLKHVSTPNRLSIDSAVESRPSLTTDSLALLQYTSGSTGDPKGVMLSHGNLLANIRTFGEVIDASSADVAVNWLPLYHDMGLIGNWLGSLYHACPVVMLSPLTFLARPERWLWAIHRFGGTLSAAPNFAYELCVHKIAERDLEGLDLKSWRMAGNGAERVDAGTIDAFAERFAAYGFRRESMNPMYGLAESSVALTITPLGRGPRVDRVERHTMHTDGRARPATADELDAMTFVSCGLPLPRHEVRVVDDANREVGDRQEGRLQFRGPSATLGYLDNPEATEVLHVGDWLETGDLGYIASGEIYMTGRSKDIIIRAGRNLYPDEIEHAIADLDHVRKGRVAVFAVDDPEAATERLVVLAETRIEDADTKAGLRHRIEEVVTALTDLPPDDVLLVGPGTVLKTANGKIRRSACRSLYQSGQTDRPAPALVQQFLGLVQASAMPEFRRLRQAAKAGLYAVYAGLLVALFAPIVWLGVIVSRGTSNSRRFLRAAARRFLRSAGLFPRVQSLDELPQGGGCVLIANHQSYLDGLVLSAVLPTDFAFVAKRELVESWFAGLFLRSLGTAFVERFDPKGSVADARQLADRLRAGESLIIFPEGTFERRPGLRSFYMGAFMAAAEAEMPIVPFAIVSTRSVLRAESWFMRHSNIEVKAGPSILSTGTSWQALIALRDQAREAVLTRCGEPDLASEPTWLESVDAAEEA